MSSFAPRGPRAFYVAGAVRDFPSDVQEWLTATTHRPASCPDLYDLLAVLARGHQPTAVVICLETVDWNELEVFDHIIRMSPATRIYVAGPPHQDKKLEAACARGALAFDADAIEEDLGYRLGRSADVGPAGLLAGTIRTEEPSTRVEAAQGAAQPEPAEEPERPSVRLVTASEEETEEPASVPVPWAPSPDRPKRTPPPSRKSPPSSGAALPGRDAPAGEAATRLTAEEMSALLGDAPGGASTLRERHGG